MQAGDGGDGGRRSPARGGSGLDAAMASQVAHEDRHFDMREVVGIQVEMEPEVLAEGRADGDGRNGRHAVRTGASGESRASGAGALRCGTPWRSIGSRIHRQTPGAHSVGVLIPRHYRTKTDTVPVRQRSRQVFR